VNLSLIWIRRPIMTSLVMCGILFFGIISYRALPVNDLPAVDFPTIQVTAGLTGANAETMASTVATPLEKQFATIAGLSSMTSTSSQGSTTITLQFSLDRNIDSAAQDVNSAISAATGLLPLNMTTKPTYKKENPADDPVIYFALTSDTLPRTTLNDYAETIISQNFSTINGVSDVVIYGEKYAVRIQVNPRVLASHSIGINQVADALSAGNVNIPGGTLDGRYQSYTLDPKGQLPRAEGYLPLIVAYQQGYPVRIKDIGKAIDSSEELRVRAWYVTREKTLDTCVIGIKKQPGSNAVRVASDVKALLPKLKEMIPRGIEMHLLYDQSEFIKESINDVQYTLLLTIFLVILVIFLFLRSIMSTIIPSIAVPLSIVATFAVMQLLGYSLNNLSLMALVLSVGFVVDDAIVMLENIIRRMEMGESAMEASLNGSKEIGFTILSMTLSLVVVFIPVLFMGGIVGRLLREFAVSIGVAILASGFISLTLTPMMCSRFLEGFHEKKRGKLYEVSERTFEKMLAFYDRTLTKVLYHRRMAMAFTGVVMIGTVVLFVMIPKGFIPSQDRNFFFGLTQAADNISYEEMARHHEKLNAILVSDPSVENIISVSGTGSNNRGFVFAHLKKASKRKMSADEIINAFRPKLNAVPGVLCFLMNPPPIEIGGKRSNALYQFTLRSTDLDVLYHHAKEMEAKIRDLPGLTDVSSDLLLKNPKVEVVVDRDRASALGLTLNQIQDAFYSSYGSRRVSTIYGTANEYYVLLEVEPEYKMDPSSLALLYIKSNNGKLVPLNAVAQMVETVGPLSVNHLGQLPSATVSFNLKPGFSIGDAIDRVKKAAKDLPQSISTVFEGSAEAFQTSFAGLGFLLLITVIVIYMVLGILYESYLHPVTILSALPLAGFGALATLMVFRMELDLYAFVGVIMLVGLVKKNGIMMIDFALETERTEKKSPEESIHHACLVRFRPIMMTTMAALLGTLPIALGIGAGGESRRPLGVAVVGGLFFSQFLTMYVTPVFYIYIDKLNRWMAERKKVKKMGS